MYYRPRMPRRYDCPYYHESDPWDDGRGYQMPDQSMMDMMKRHTQLLQDIHRTTRQTHRLTQDIHRWVRVLYQEEIGEVDM